MAVASSLGFCVSATIANRVESLRVGLTGADIYVGRHLLHLLQSCEPFVGT